MTQPAPTILILAAGASRRMRGADKLMEPVAGEPLIRRQVRMALATGLAVRVAMAPDRTARTAALDGLAITTIPVPDAASGMAASIRAGVAGLPPAPLLLLLADLPELTTDDLLALIAAAVAAPDLIHRATSAEGTPGHPVLFPAWALPELAGLTGDSGARDMLMRHAARVHPVPLPNRHAVTDLDTPEDWAVWRARTGL